MIKNPKAKNMEEKKMTNKISCQCIPSPNFKEIVEKKDYCEHFMGDCSFMEQEPACEECEFREVIEHGGKKNGI